MKKLVLVFSIIILFTLGTKSSAQPFKVGVFTGYGLSSFEEFNLFGIKVTESAGYLPLGLQAAYSLEKLKFGSIDFGLEFNYAAVPFSYEIQNTQGQKLVDTKYKQLIIAALVKVKFLKKNKLNPFVRVGGGLYSGNLSFEYTDAAKQMTNQTLQESQDIDSGFGFNIGGGTDIKIGKNNAVFVEFVYHLVSRTAKGAKESTRLNNWAIQAGYQIGLGK